nr:phospholipid-transporting ATPase 1-like [Tanacetum cinerariifolium]
MHPVDSITFSRESLSGTLVEYVVITGKEKRLHYGAVLIDLLSRCDVVLCCRVALLQKARIVMLIRKRTDDLTLAIGDGENEVSMIQKADVGVGINGQKDRRAVMASDFAMTRYALFTAFTLSTAINEWSSVLYSVIYAAVPTIVVGILDKDLDKTSLLRYPQLYEFGQKQESYNGLLFWLTVADTLWQMRWHIYIQMPLIQMQDAEHVETKSSLVSETLVTPSAPKGAIKAFRLLNENPQAQTVVASIASEPDVWNVVMQNAELVDFLQTHKTEVVHPDVKDASDYSSEADESESLPGKGFMEYVQELN